MEHLPKNALKVFRAYLVIIFAGCSLIAVTAVFTGFLRGVYGVWAELALFGVFCVSYFYFAKKYYENYRYSLNCQRIKVKKGFLFTLCYTVPLNSVMYVDIFENPLQRRYSLCTAGIVCPGAGRILISQIEYTEAERIRQYFGRVKSLGGKVEAED